MTEISNTNTFPPFLDDYGSFYSHIQGQLEGVSNQVKGQKFAEFSCGIILNSELGRRFQTPQLRPASHDGGVDLEAKSLDGAELLFGQSKYTIASVDDLALIFDKFQDYEKQQRKKEPVQAHQLQLIEDEDNPPDFDIGDIKDKTIHYVVISASKVVDTQKLTTYENSTRSSAPFYNQLKSEERVHFFDGPKILPIAKTAFQKRHFIPTDLSLELVKPFIFVENVYLGIVSANHLRRLYDEFGEGLFLENIREWLGPYSGKVPQQGRETVNQAISRTLKEEPGKFLARNNGITFRASSVKEENANTLELSEASIVNGCQTTMSIVNNPGFLDSCHILVKVVQTDDAWDIAGSANFQTKVDRIDLDIARYTGTQAMSAAADKYGVSLKKTPQIPNSIFDIFAAISKAEITEGEVRALFIGLFSRNPNNAIDMNYTELRTDLLQKYEASADKDTILYSLFKIQETTQKAAAAVEEGYDKSPRKRKGQVSVSELFQRFWHDNSKNAPNYRAFLTILAACGSAGENFYERGSELNYKELCKFLNTVLSIVENEPDTFVRYYRQAFMSLALKVIDAESDIDKTLQNMTTYIKRAKFDNLYLMLEALSYGE